MRSADLTGRTVVVWGAGKEGTSVARHLAGAGVTDLTVTEDDEGTRAAAEVALAAAGLDVPIVGGDAGTDARERAGVIVISPGISRYRADVVALRERGTVITNATALALTEARDRGSEVIGITGSKGKSTTTALTRHLLHLAGHDAEEGGNFGRPALDLVAERHAILVLEVSSYQASEVELGPDHAVLTALFPEHLDWHRGVEQYYADKLRLLRAAQVRTICVNATDANALAHTDDLDRRLYGTSAGIHAHDGALHVGGRRLVATGDRLRGAHTLTNVAGALTVATALDPRLLDEPELLDEWLTTFEPLPHRLQPIGEHAGVEYVDDSIATSPSATAAALDAYADRSVTLLVGGHDRSLPLDPLLAALARRTAPTRVLAMPTTGEHVADAIAAHLDVRDLTVVRCDSLDDAVRHAVAHTPSGGVVLLSPAAASYDRFTSYAHRGAEYQRLVREHAAG